MDNNKIEQMLEKYPFLAIVRYSTFEFVCIIQNQDSDVTTIYDYGSIRTEQERVDFLNYADQWWWESNRMIPINIFLNNEMAKFSFALMTMNSKDVKVTIGPCVNLNALNIKRVKRKSVQLVRKSK